jgi:hypothetical protein
MTRPLVTSANESDPQGLSPHSLGAKLDNGKVRLGLVVGGFSKALYEVGRVGTYGAEKYTDSGWLYVANGFDRYTDAMFRHLLAESSGESRDAESDLLHAAHAAWNALARLELLLRKRPSRSESFEQVGKVLARQGVEDGIL